MGISGDKAKAACRAMKRGDLLVFLVSLNDATIAAWGLENEDQDETIVSYIDRVNQKAVAQAAAAQLQATQAAHAAGVNVKKEGSATSIIFRTVDAAELLKLVESEFGAGGRLKTNDGSVVGTNSPLEHGATLIWHPPAGGAGTGKAPTMPGTPWDQISYGIKSLSAFLIPAYYPRQENKKRR
ncbi:hypothetical protein QJQ45_027973 [Haematococcus lacustris]|nr:hypothetical protein QJQ45_027973 [Haematococcus lacustris]